MLLIDGVKGFPHVNIAWLPLNMVALVNSLGSLIALSASDRCSGDLFR